MKPLLWSEIECRAVTRWFEQDGGNLTYCSTFGVDPLQSNDRLLSERQRHFQCKFPSFETIFHSLVNGNKLEFRNGLIYFIQLTNSLSKYL